MQGVWQDEGEEDEEKRRKEEEGGGEGSEKEEEREKEERREEEGRRGRVEEEKGGREEGRRKGRGRGGGRRGQQRSPTPALPGRWLLRTGDRGLRAGWAPVLVGGGAPVRPGHCDPGARLPDSRPGHSDLRNRVSTVKGASPGGSQCDTSPITF